MSNGDTSNTDGSQSARPTHEDAGPVRQRGKILSELLERLDAQTRAASASVPSSPRRTSPGTRANRPPAPPMPGARSRRRITLTSVVLTIAAGIVGAAVIAAYLIRPEAALPAPEGLLQTRIQMKGLEMAVRMYWARYNRIPEGSISNILTVLSASNLDAQNPDRIVFMKLRQPEYRFGRMVKPGDVDENGNYLDGWGRPMQLEVHPETLSMRIRSFGPDGKDEGGKGDDIEMLILANY